MPGRFTMPTGSNKPPIAAPSAKVRLVISSVGLLVGAVAAAVLLPSAQAWLHWISIEAGGG